MLTSEGDINNFAPMNDKILDSTCILLTEILIWFMRLFTGKIPKWKKVAASL